MGHRSAVCSSLGGWRAIFLVNLPWVAVAIWLALRSVPRRLPATDQVTPISAAPSLLACCSSTAWLLNPGDVPGWTVLAAAAALVLLVVAFVRYELRQDDPILEPRFLRVGRSRRRRPRSG